MVLDVRLFWLALGGFAGGTEGALIGGLLPGIGDEMGITVGEAGYLVVAHALAYGIGTPILATLLANINRRRILAGAEFVFACAAILVALSPSFAPMIGARIFVALGAGLYTASAMATAVQISPPERRGRAIGTVVMGQSLASLAGVPLGAWLASTYSWRVSYLMIGALGIVASIALFTQLPRGLTSERRTLRERLSVLKTPGVPMALFISLIFTGATSLPVVYVGPLALETAHLGRDMLPFVLLAAGLGAFAGANLGGRLADRLGSTNAILVTAVAQLGVLLAFIGIAWLPAGLALPAFLTTMGVASFVTWAYWPAQSSRLAELAPTAVPLALALNMTAFNIGIAITARAGGATVDTLGALAAVWVAVPFAVVTILVVWWVGRSRPATPR